MSEKNSSLEVQGLKKSYGAFSVSLDFKVDAGETLALVGPSGSGKTTVINLIAGLLSPDAGKIIVNGEELNRLPAWKRNISMVFQDLALFPHLDVGGNINYGLVIRKVPRKERQKIINETLEMVRLPSYASRRIHTLSGGERQRVAIARALASKPRALLLDEPFSSLDIPLRKMLRQEFLEIRSHSKAPCLFVTHDREEALMLGDKVALMSEGRIVESGSSKEIFLNPKTEFAARFFGAGQILPCKVLQKHCDGTFISSPLGSLNVPISGTPGDKFFIPNDAISLEEFPSAPDRKSFSALCTGSFFSGPNFVVKLSLDDSSSFEIISGARTAAPSPGCVVNAWIDQSLLRFVEQNPQYDRANE